MNCAPNCKTWDTNSKLKATPKLSSTAMSNGAIKFYIALTACSPSRSGMNHSGGFFWPATEWEKNRCTGTGPKHGLLWGSEAKALLAAPWVERRVNALALHHYLTLQYVPDPLTIFEDMHRLPAAHKLVVERGGEPKVSRWWQLEFEPKWKIDDRGSHRASARSS